jgi:hypothetical protein
MELKICAPFSLGEKGADEVGGMREALTLALSQREREKR